MNVGPSSCIANRQANADKRDSKRNADSEDSSTSDDQALASNENERGNKNKSARSTDEVETRTSGYRGTADNRQANSKMKNNQENAEGQLWVVTVTSPVVYLDGTQQSSTQKHQCSEACKEYSKEIRNTWKEVHKLHGELVQLEAQQYAAIEDILNEDQLEQLKSDRQQPERETASVDE